MNGGGGARNQQSDQSKQNQDKNCQRAIVTISELLAEPDSMGEQSHAASERVCMHESSLITGNTVANHNMGVND